MAESRIGLPWLIGKPVLLEPHRGTAPLGPPRVKPWRIGAAWGVSLPFVRIRQNSTRATFPLSPAIGIHMTSYVEGALVKDEKIIHLGHISLWSLWHIIALGILLLPAFGLGLIFLIIAYVRYKTTELAITTKRVIVKHGFIRRRTVEININKVESIQVDQEVMGRMFNFGTLVIAGAGNPQAPITGISSPMAFRKAFIEAQDQAKSGA